MLCLVCGFDTDRAEPARVLAVLADAEDFVANLSGEPDVDGVLRLCAALVQARRALIGSRTQHSRREGDEPIARYSALAILGTEASWLQRAARAVPAAFTPSPVVAEAAHALEHASGRLLAPHSAGETSPLS